MGLLSLFRKWFYGDDTLIDEIRELEFENSEVEYDSEFVNRNEELANHQFAWYLKTAVDNGLIKDYKKLMNFIHKNFNTYFSNDPLDIIPLKDIKPTEAIKSFIKIFFQFSYKTKDLELAKYVELNK